MPVVQIDSNATRKVAIRRPRTKLLVDEHAADDGRLAAVHVLLPPGGTSPPQDHGEPALLVAPFEGWVTPSIADQQVTSLGGPVRDSFLGTTKARPPDRSATVVDGESCR